ncbi:MAG: hypothetical protein AB1763_09450 [Campylobacterota bacterium]|nr:hypothetical protein [Sulfuricurvum sp.]
MELLSQMMPLLNFAMVFIVIPLYKTIRNQETQIGQLKTIITDQQKQIELLEAIVFESASAEVVRKHLLRRGNHVQRD